MRLLRLSPPGLAMTKHETYESDSVYIVPPLRAFSASVAAQKKRSELNRNAFSYVNFKILLC
ncbi:hypothetical protein SAMN04488023_1365 [Pedobacter rhizosphaerae]|uniref:Uncharacterized protein n=1 Tax=Pedobacter rhizosphaerae TaxID=390241 RepID=A0A1H9V1B2_9SPHI|nr:hypothetical protein SAMN04488023_1365 [Pedobacter rhizosphaerae]